MMTMAARHAKITFTAFNPGCERSAWIRAKQTDQPKMAIAQTLNPGTNNLEGKRGSSMPADQRISSHYAALTSDRSTKVDQGMSTSRLDCGSVSLAKPAAA